ncbi:MAG: hypothetical protein R3F33_11080 [Planctomycetota bacterium]
MPSIELYANGRLIDGWSTLEYSSSIDALADEVSVNGPASVFAGLHGGEQIICRYEKELFFTGWADEVEIELTDTDAKASIRARSRTCDLVDSSIGRMSQLSGGNLSSIAYFLTQFEGLRIGVRNNVPSLPIIPRATFQVGETIHDAIERYARPEGVLLRSDPDGQLVLEKVGQRRSGQALQLGRNLKGLTLRTNLTGRFRNLQVVGQSTDTDDFALDTAVSAEGNAEDRGIRGSRQIVIQAPGNVTPYDCQRIAEWHAAVNAARSTSATCLVEGWTSSGLLWASNALVSVDAQDVGVEGEFLVAGLSLKVDGDSGESGRLELVDPKAYVPEPVRGEVDDSIREQMKEGGWL